MAEHTTYVKLDRNMIRWGWYKDTNTKALFIHLILMANVKPAKFQDIVVQRGQLVTSLHNLGQQTGLTLQAVRTALEHLKSTNEITMSSTNRYTLITLNNYSAYQDKATNKSTNKQQTDNKQTTNKQQQSKNNKKDNANALSKKEKNCADAPTPAARDWEIEKKVPQRLWGAFEDYKAYNDWRLAH